jgi:hypothetical protein
MEGLEAFDRGLTWVATPVSYIPFVALPVNVYLGARAELSSVYDQQLQRGGHPGWSLLPAAGGALVRGGITAAVGRFADRFAGFGQAMLSRSGRAAGQLARGTTRHLQRGVRAVANAVVGVPAHAVEAHLGNMAADAVTSRANDSMAPSRNGGSQYRVSADTKAVRKTIVGGGTTSTPATPVRR